MWHRERQLTYTMPYRANSHRPCCAPAVLRQCRVLRKSPRVAGKNRNVNRETSRGSSNKPKLGRSPTGCRETAHVNSHIQCRVPAVLCSGTEKSFEKLHDRSTAGTRHCICESNTVALS